MRLWFFFTIAFHVSKPFVIVISPFTMIAIWLFLSVCEEDDNILKAIEPTPWYIESAQISGNWKDLPMIGLDTQLIWNLSFMADEITNIHVSDVHRWSEHQELICLLMRYMRPTFISRIKQEYSEEALKACFGPLYTWLNDPELNIAVHMSPAVFSSGKSDTMNST